MSVATADIESLRATVAAFVEAADREYYLHFAGHKPTLESAAIAERLLGDVDAGALAAVREAAAGAPPEEARRLRALALAVADLVVERSLAPVADGLAAAQATATVEVDGESIPYYSAAARIQNEPDRARRRRLAEARDAVTDGHNPLRERLLREHHGVVRSLEPAGYVALYGGLRDIDLQALGAVMHTFLDETAATWERAVTPWFEEAIGVPFAQAERHDAAHLFRLGEHDAWFGGEGMVEALRRTLLGLGVALDDQPNVVLDLEDRPGKSPRAFCAPVRVPDEVYLVIRPTGGYQDWRALFHEAGHTEHFATTDAARPVEERHLGDYSVTEAYAFTLEHLLLDRGWLEEFTPASGAGLDRLVHRGHINLLHYLRRYAAKLLYELELHGAGPEGLAAMPERYATLLTGATGFRYGGEAYLDDVDPGFYCANYLRAWMLEAMLAERFRADHGAAWWRPGGAGADLRGLWSMGSALPAHELSEEVGLGALAPDALRRRFDAVLGG